MGIRIVRNHYGWNWRGIRVWMRFGWCRYCVWGIESRPTRLCRKVGPIAWCHRTTPARMNAALADRRKAAVHA